MMGLTVETLMNQEMTENGKNTVADKGKYNHELGEILSNKDIKAVFQPIVSLLDGEIFGYEALSRGPQGSVLEKPDALFSTAEECNKVWELEFLCRGKALDRAKSLPKDKMLFINVDPKLLKIPVFKKGLP